MKLLRKIIKAVDDFEKVKEFKETLKDEDVKKGDKEGS